MGPVDYFVNKIDMDRDNYVTYVMVYVYKIDKYISFYVFNVVFKRKK